MSLKVMDKIYTLEGDRLRLRTLQPSDRSERYLAWLNDAEVQKYTRRSGVISTMSDIDSFIAYSLACSDFHFAIFLKDSDSYIGNVSLNSVNERHKNAEVSIMLGDRSCWGRGYAAEAINLVVDFAFKDLTLHRVWAESCNPAFIALMKKLNWREEGIRRDAVFLNNKYLDYIDWSVLESEWPIKK
ncbi:MAG: GNAT family protein [bacterium]|nr:GNAT family protein [bacterium]